ncbi:MAG: nucleotidyltransferase domain-containing protein [Endomicrobiales bacterium]
MKFHISPIEMINSLAKISIIRHLMMFESPMSEREIASVIRIPHTSVNRTLKELAQYNMVSYSVAGKTHLWKINKKSYGYTLLSDMIKDISSLKYPLDNLQKTIQDTLPLELIKRVVLFGSVAKGLEKADSDIDLFILVQNDTNKNEIQKAIGDLSNKCLDAYGNRLEAYILTDKELTQKEDLNILREIEKGIQIFPKTLSKEG